VSSTKKKSVLTQLLVGQSFLIIVNGLILVITALAVAPSIFNKHLHDAGVVSASARTHVLEAYVASFNASLLIAAFASIIISGGLAWYFMVRIVKPIKEVTVFAETLASGDLDAQSPIENSIPELNRLTEALAGMSEDLTLSRQEQSRLLSDLAHELRTPISTVLAIVDGIEDEVIHPDARTWKTVRDQLERVNRLSHDVREVTQNSEKLLSTLSVAVEPGDMARAAFAAWNPRIDRKGINFELEIEPDLPHIYVDPQRIGQVLSNLLENALRYTPTGGKIDLRVSSTSGNVLFAVIDSGQGIKAHQLPYLFDRLYRGDAARHSGESGSGLGLTIARSIAQSHGGVLTAMSEGRDLGSTFTLSLPMPNLKS